MDLTTPVRIPALVAGFVYALFCAAKPSSAAQTPRPPNVVLIFTDDQGYGDVGVFGAKGFTTPNLDQMAREGRRFTDFHVAQAVCSASRAALLTGCYPNRIGLSGALGPGSKVALSTKEVTLARLFKQSGYATGMAGKWHLGDRPEFLPLQHGFDEYFGLPYSNDMWPRHPEARPGAYPPLPLIEGSAVVKEDLQPADQEQLTVQYAERGVRFIERNKDRPFFFYLAPNMPHVPLHVSGRFKGKSGTGLYGDVIMEIDWAVGELLSALKRLGLEDNTLVIFASDNGPWLSYGNHSGSSGGLREGKGTSFEGGHRVPCIMKWPGNIPPNSVCDVPLMTIDLFPTLARLVGAALPPHRIDGLDVWPLVAGVSGASNPHEGYYHYYNRNDLQAVRQGDWKLVFAHTSRSMQGADPGHDGIPGKYAQLKVGRALYNLKTDRAELQDVASDHSEIVARLEVLAEKARADLGDDLSGRPARESRPSGRVQ